MLKNIYSPQPRSLREYSEWEPGLLNLLGFRIEVYTRRFLAYIIRLVRPSFFK